MAKLHKINEQSYDNRRLKFFMHHNIGDIKEKHPDTLWMNKNWDSPKFEEL